MSLAVEDERLLGALLLALIDPEASQEVRALAATAVREAFDFEEEKHPRGPDGKFIETGGEAEKPEEVARSVTDRGEAPPGVAPGPGAVKRELVEPRDPSGRPIGERNDVPGMPIHNITPEGDRVFAVERSDGGQVIGRIDAGVPVREQPSEYQMQEVLSTLADLQEQQPLRDDVDVRVVSLSWFQQATNLTPSEVRQTNAASRPEEPTIYLVGNNIWSATGIGAMPAFHDVGAARYITSHEYGHQVMFQQAQERPTPEAVFLTLPERSDPPEVGGLSLYGNVNPHEAYAEAFAQHALDGDNLSTATYANVFRWMS